jgi:galactofuranosylgalactofuranosylrhamnosyl-N-acetylglucosaminyl-diphospho-decaprenol beta-1,5/1,6-galactofuranosyltransferase
MRFQTMEVPRDRPMLTLGICTFNREPYLYKNLLELEKFAQDTHSISEIILVNQGEQFVNEGLKSLVSKSGNIRLIEQANLGGCGGFTRTMYESLASEVASHHVLMDDDAQMDPRILANLEYFLSHLSTDIVVGGHMLDLYQPWMLYEAGAMVKPNSRIKPLHKNIDLRRIDALHPFLRFHASDYNAWWFCAIPVKQIKAADFPAPIFIRGDDMEYGVRLQEMGIRTVAMPGIAVWHEPFYAKAGSWQVYYDYRNRMIMASMYPDRFVIETPKMMAWEFFRALALHNYQEAALIIRAIDDFLLGPELFSDGANKLHARVSALAKEYSPQTVADLSATDRISVKDMPSSEFRIIALIVKRIGAVFLARAGQGKRPCLVMDSDANLATIGNFPYVKTNGPNTYKLLYSPNRVSLEKLLVDGVRAIIAYRKNAELASVQWRDQMHDFRGRDSWEQIFRDSVPQKEGSNQVDILNLSSL